jgi:hypothetical protein
MPFGETINNSILDHFVNQTSWTAPTATYASFSTTTPTTTGTNFTEATGGGYARVQVTTAIWGAPATSSITTGSDTTWTQASADWSTGSNMDSVVLWDAATAGNFLGWKELTVKKAVLNGDTAKFLTGDLTITMGGTS